MKNFAILLSSLILVACADRKSEIEKEMKRYDRLTFRMAADSMADTYVDNGRLGGKGMKLFVGRDSIRKFLKSFDPSKITLISNGTTAKSINFNSDTVVVEGTYEQKAKLGSDTGVYTGSFTAKWVNEKNRWLLASMYTVPTIKQATLKSTLLRQLKTTHTEKDWFVPANIAVEGLTAKQAMWTDGSGNHSVGQLATHLIYWNERMLHTFKGEENPKFSGNNEETFSNSFDEKSWEATVKKLDEVLSSWESEIKNASDDKLSEWSERIANMNTHNAYHTGQIIFLRKLQGSWNPEKGVK